MKAFIHPSKHVFKKDIINNYHQAENFLSNRLSLHLLIKLKKWWKWANSDFLWDKQKQDLNHLNWKKKNPFLFERSEFAIWL